MNSFSIYSEIGGEGITPKDVVAFLDENKNRAVTIRINSMGGSVYQGLAIHSLLMAHTGFVTVVIDGLCASIATIIAMGANRIEMDSEADFFIHNPWTEATGEAETFRKLADDMDNAKAQLLSIYMSRFNGTQEELEMMLDVQTWLSPEQAKISGFVDTISEPIRMCASLKHDVSKYFNKQKENKMAEQTEKVEAEVVTPEVENKAEEILAEVTTEEVVAEVTEEIAEEVVEISEEDRIQALVDEGIAKEMKRQSDIKDLAFEGQSELVASLISEKCSVSDASVRIITDKKAMNPIVATLVAKAPSEVAPVVNEAEQILASMSNGAPAPLNEGIESEGTQTLSGIRAKIEKSTDREEKRVLGMELALLKKSQS